MLMKNRLLLIATCVVIIIVIFSLSVWLACSFPARMVTAENTSAGKNHTPVFDDTNLSLTTVSPGLDNELANLEKKYQLSIKTWDFNPDNNTWIDLYTYGFLNTSTLEGLPGTPLGNYTIHSINNTPCIDVEGEVFQKLMEYENDPVYQDYQVARVSTGGTDTTQDPSTCYAEVWVYKSTPENKNLDNTMIKGSIIHIYSLESSIEMQNKLKKKNDAARIISDSNNRFAFDLYSNLRQNPSYLDRNLILSPISLSMTFALMDEGASSTTADEINSVFYFSADHETTRTGFAAIIEGMNQSDSRIHFANGIWTDYPQTIQPEFVEIARNNYSAEASSLDFRNFHAAGNAINTWTREKTGGIIATPFPEYILNPDTCFVLTNAIRFNGTWSEAFNESETRQGKFFGLNGTSATVPMMHRQGEILYNETTDLQVVSLPYHVDGEVSGKKYSMLILLPRDNNITTAESVLNDKDFWNIYDSLHPKQLELSLPRFSQSSTSDIRSTLSSMGMQTIFGPEASLSGVAGNGRLYINNVIQSAGIDVNEEGMKAADTSMVENRVESMPVVFSVSHPFVYLIVDDSFRDIIFIGRIVRMDTVGIPGNSLL